MANVFKGVPNGTPCLFVHVLSSFVQAITERSVPCVP